MKLTLSQIYYHDRDIITRGYHNSTGRLVPGTLDEIDQVWRSYQKALFYQLERRSMKRIGGTTMRNRFANGDDELPMPFAPRWNSVSDEELMELYDTLANAGYRGPRKRKKKAKPAA